MTTALEGTVQQQGIKDERNFYQAGVFWNNLNEQDKKDLISNFAGDLNKVNNPEIKHTILAFIYKSDADYGQRLTKAVNGDLKEVKSLASKL